MVGKLRNTGWLVRSLLVGGAVGALALSPGAGWAEDEQPGARVLVVERGAEESAADAAVRAKLAGPAATVVGRSVTLASLAEAYGKALGVEVAVTEKAKEAAMSSGRGSKEQPA